MHNKHPNIKKAEDLRPLFYSLAVMKQKIQSAVVAAADSGDETTPGRILPSVSLGPAGSCTVSVLVEVCERTTSKPGLSYIAGVSLMPESIIVLNR